ncbi:MAG: YafY family protein [Eubacteriales bacterium]|nr:YafY family protein [Eubacteriales bacterium]
MKLDRLVSIVMMLLDQQRVGAQELAERFEVSSRTIYRDVEAINRAGIPIRSTPGVGGGFEIMPEYKLDRKVFSSADLSTLLMGLSSLSPLIRGEELVHALTKVKSFIPADRAKEIEVRANQIYIDLSPWMGNRSIEIYLEIIKQALRESRLLGFTYTDHHGERTLRTVEPYQLVLKNSHWYLQGYCHVRMDYRLFKLTRMANLHLQANCFSPRDFPKPILDFDEGFEKLQTKLTLCIQPSVMDRVLDLCPYEDFHPQEDGCYLVDFPFIENEYYYDLLLSFGDQCQCLEPKRIRAEIKRRALAIAALYDDAFVRF